MNHTCEKKLVQSLYFTLEGFTEGPHTFQPLLEMRSCHSIKEKGYLLKFTLFLFSLGKARITKNTNPYL